MRLELRLENDWLEATWSENGNQIHCEAFSGHSEHITILRNRLAEYGTETTVQDEELITKCQVAFVYPTETELKQQELRMQLQEAQFLLDSTQFKFGDDYDQKDTPEWFDLKAKRQVAREFIRINR